MGRRRFNDDSYNLEPLSPPRSRSAAILAEQLAWLHRAGAAHDRANLIDLVDERVTCHRIWAGRERLGASQRTSKPSRGAAEISIRLRVCARLERMPGDPAPRTQSIRSCVPGAGEHSIAAKRDIASLRKLCASMMRNHDMNREIRRLDPKPGLKFGSARIRPWADVYVRPDLMGAGTSNST